MERHIFPTFANAFAFEVWIDGERITDLNATTRVKVSFAGYTVDSNADPSYFDWTVEDEDGSDLVVCAFGNLDLPTGKYGASIIYYSADHPNGIVLSTAFPITVTKIEAGVAPSVAGLTLDDIPDGVSYSKVLATSLQAGEVLVSELIGDLGDLVGDLDSIADGTTYGKVLKASLTAGGLVLLSAVSGTLDDVADGTTYARVAAAALTAGGLVLLSATTGDTDDLSEGLINTFFSGKTLDDLPDGTSFKRASASALTAGGLVILSAATGDSDDIIEGAVNTFFGGKTLDDLLEGTSWKRVAAAAVDGSGLIVMSAVQGDLDDIADGATWAKVALTSVSAGKIIVAGLDAGVTTRMFTDANARTDIEAWRHASDVTLIDGGDIYTGTVTLNALAFTPVQSTDVIAKINASAEGITIDADNIAISGATTFSAGYDPTDKLAAEGGSYDSAASGARVRIFPDANTGILVETATRNVFSALVGGVNVGDVVIGDPAGDNVKWDDSAGAFVITGDLIATGNLNTDAVTELDADSDALTNLSDTNWVNVCTVSLTVAAGVEVIIHGSTVLATAWDTSNVDLPEMRITLGASTVKFGPVQVTGPNDSAVEAGVNGIVVETPGAGTHTYNLQCRKKTDNVTADCTSTQSAMYILARKR